MPRTITSATSLENLKKEAKRWLKALRTQDPDARVRFDKAWANAPARPVLREVQHALAREFGCDNWIALKQALVKPAVEASVPDWTPRTSEEYERAANDWVLANNSQDPAALQRLNDHYRRAFTFDNVRAEIWRRVYAFRQRSSRVPENFLQLDEARTVIAQDAGFGSWARLMQAIPTGGSRVPAYAVDPAENCIAPRRQLSDQEWDEIVDVMKERRIAALECPNFGSRGFVAFSRMPALRGLGVGCQNVSDEALSTLPDFPALRELTPIGVTDAGFRHVGRCERLERLTCMYCRETTDAATEHIGALQLQYYYAGLTLITDRSLEILGRMTSLEQIELYETKGITDAGLVFLKGLPRLREVHLDSLPGMTLDGTRVFPAHVRVRYST